MTSFETALLKALYGELPINGHLKSIQEHDLRVGDFETDPEELKSKVLESEEALDFLIDQYNEKLRTRLGRLGQFENAIPYDLRKSFQYQFKNKRTQLHPLSKVAQLRDNYLTSPSPYDDEKASLSKFESQLSLSKQETVAKLGPTFFFRKSFPVVFPFAQRQRHAYCLGSSGSGKSELIKVHVFHDNAAKPGCIVFDPHGDLVRDCSRFKDQGSEIIYLSAEFGKLGFYPRYNPFQHDYHGKPEMEKQAYISVKAQELMNAFEIVMGTEFSQNMRRIVFNILQVLLNNQGMNLNDFLRFLRPATSEHYEKLAGMHYNENVRLFFKHDFNLKTLSVTKQSVLTRFENALSNYHLAQIFDCRESSFDLKGLLDQGKCILVNCSQGLLGEYGCKILGSFLVSELTTHALQRGSISSASRRPIMCYIDECQNFLTERIDKVLSEARKYGLHLFLANQFLGQIESLRLRASILANTSIKCCGKTSIGDFEKMSKELGYDSRKAPRLGKGKFIVKVGAYKPIVFQAYDFLLKKAGPSYLDKEGHRKRLNQVIAQYYKKAEPKTAQGQAQSNQGFTQSPTLIIPNPEKLL